MVAVFAACAIVAHLLFGNSQETEHEGEIESGINGHAYVDLGLSVKWATCNIGASGGVSKISLGSSECFRYE